MGEGGSLKLGEERDCSQSKRGKDGRADGQTDRQTDRWKGGRTNRQKQID